MQELVIQLKNLLQKKNMKLSVAESCTGGLLASTITEIPGASLFFERGFVTYSNLSKTELLGVKPQTLSNHGAVSLETAKEMAQGALFNSQSDIAASITGITGPEGGSAEKPVGLICFGYALKNGTTETISHIFSGSRAHIREQAVQTALQRLLSLAEAA